MTQDYDNTNRGSLFRNDRKESENHPDYKGSINVGGTDYWLSSWLKTSKDGKRYMSLSVQPKEQPQTKPQPKQRVQAPQDDEIPF